MVATRDNTRQARAAQLSDAERTVIANLLRWPDSLGLCGDLDQKHFHNETLGRIYSTVAKCQIEDRDVVDTLIDEVKVPIRELSDLIDEAISPQMSMMASQRIIGAHETRKLHESLYSTVHEIASDPFGETAEDRIARLQTELEEITPKKKEKGTGHIREISAALMKEIEKGDDVIPSGFPSLDRCFRGWPKGTLSLVAGRPGMGKSAFCINAVMRLARAGIPVLFVGLEDRKEQHVRRILSIDAQVDTALISHENVRKDTNILLDITPAIMRMAQYPIYVIDGPLSSLQIVREVKRYVQEYGVQAVFVDHAQEIETDIADRNNNRTYEIQESVKKLRDVAMKLNIPVILASQINREGVGRPEVYHLRDSGALEMIARLILLLYRDEVYNENTDDKGILEVKIGKANHGPSGSTVRLKWIGERCEVAELARY